MAGLDKFLRTLASVTKSQRPLSPEQRRQRSKQREANYEHRRATYPYDSHAQRERYARQEARRLHKLAALQEDDSC